MTVPEVFYTDADLASASNFDDTNVSLSTEVILPAGTITRFRWRAPSVAIGTTTPVARLYDSTGALLASAYFDTLTVGAWNYATLFTPVHIGVAGTYYPTVYCNRYVAALGFFPGSPIARGSFTAIQSRWTVGDTSPHAGSTSTAAFFIDAEFTADGPSEGALDPAFAWVDIGSEPVSIDIGSGTIYPVADIGNPVVEIDRK